MIPPAPTCRTPWFLSEPLGSPAYRTRTAVLSARTGRKPARAPGRNVCGRGNRCSVEHKARRSVRPAATVETRNSWRCSTPGRRTPDATCRPERTAVAIRYRIALGPEAGRRTLTLKNPSLARSDNVPKALTTDQNGFSLNAAVACQPHERDRLARIAHRFSFRA